MYQAQTFGSDIRNKKAAAHGSLRKLIQTGFQAFLLTHGHSAFILGIQLLIFLILTIIMLNERLESETQRMTLIGSGATNQCHVQNGTFQPVALHLHQMGVTNPHGNGRKDSRSNIIHRVALTIVQTADNTLNPDRKISIGNSPPDILAPMRTASPIIPSAVNLEVSIFMQIKVITSLWFALRSMYYLRCLFLERHGLHLLAPGLNPLQQLIFIEVEFLTFL